MKKLACRCIASFAVTLLLTGCHTTPQFSQKQEYKFVRLIWGDDDSPDSRLNAVARQGWTIQESSISYTPHVYTGLFLFKRPAP